ncbi:MAG: RsmB/NOP family class I SAM-dependent RNA methyltransferase [Planctomycetota bacterium]
MRDVPPSACGAALLLLLRWDSQKRLPIEGLVGQFLDDSELPDRDERFLAELCHGVVRHRETLRALSEHFIDDPLSRYHRSVRMAISLALFQRVYLRTPATVVVDSTIEAWKQLPGGGGEHLPEQPKLVSGFLTALLRRTLEHIDHLPLDAREPDDPECVRCPGGWARIRGLALPPRQVHLARLLGLKHSHPTEMVRVWLERMDEGTVIQLLEHDNCPPPQFIVLRKDGGSIESYLRKLHVLEIGAKEVGVGLPEGREDRDMEFGAQIEGTTAMAAEEGPFGAEEMEPGGADAAPLRCIELPHGTRVERLPGYDEGLIWVQDPTARRITLSLPEREHATLLDLCASPGGMLATLLDRGDYREVLACDVSEHRLRSLAVHLQRLRFDLGKVSVTEVPEDPERLRVDHTFDQVLVDPPCSGTGVLARHLEARWRFLPEELRRLQRLQIGLLRAGVAHLAPGGDLLYCTCSIEPVENSSVVHAVLRSSPQLHLVQEWEIIPGEGDADGGYGALLKRRE